MVKLSQKQWTLLYKVILVLALRMTYTRVKDFQWTARDRAQEAVQRAFERFLRVQPPHVTDVEKAKSYLVAAVRSELSNVRKREAYRKKLEDAAAVEDATLGRDTAKSAEQMNIEKGERLIDNSRAVRMVAKCREILAGDRIALGTMDLIADDEVDVWVHARVLGCEVEDIYNARKRRRRAMQKAEEAVRAEDAANGDEDTANGDGENDDDKEKN